MGLKNIFASGEKKTAEKVIRVVADYTELHLNEITTESRFLEDLGISSQDLLTCSKEVEEKFGISLYDTFDMTQEKVETVGDLVNLVVRAKGM